MSGAGPNLGRIAYAHGSRLRTVRQSDGAYVGGEWQVTGDRDTQRRLTVRKISPSDRKLLPEGMRTEDSISVQAAGALRIESNNVDGAVSPDRILHDGWWWKVVGEVSWAPVGFRRYVAVREAKWRERP